MKRKTDPTNRNTYFLPFLIMMLSFPFILIAGDNQGSAYSDSLMNVYSHRTFSFEGTLYFGFGTKNLTVGQTTQNEDVTMSGGGGIGGVLSVFYNINPSVELGLSIGSQSSSLSKNVENAEGKFDRRKFLLTVKYDVPLSNLALLKIGGGMGYYIPGELDLDLSKVASGAHNIYSYDNSAGFHFVVDYVRLISQNWSWGAGIKYSNVSYDLKSAKSNGVNIPLNLLSSAIKNEVGKLDGSGFDISIFIAYHLY